MPAGVLQATLPYCRSCGWDYVQTNDKGSDLVCDSCGDELTNSGDAGGLDAATTPGSTPGVADVTFTWVENADADDTETRASVDGAAFSAWTSDTSPTIVAGTAGQVIVFQIRSVMNSVSGPVYGPTLEITDTVTP